MNAPTKVLVVDNDEILLQAICLRLRATGLEVSAAVNASQALSLFDEHPVDVVVSDVNMPGVDGVGLAERLRERSDVPVLLMTCYGWSYGDAFGHVPGVRMIEKPFALEDMLADLAEMLAEREHEAA